MFRNALRLFTGAAVLTAAATTWADIVILNNNSMLVGDHVAIVDVTDEFVVVEYINEGRPASIIFRRAEVMRMVRSDEQTSQPSITPEQPIADIEQPAIPAIPDDITTLTPDPSMGEFPLSATQFPLEDDPPPQPQPQDVQDVQDVQGGVAPLLPVVMPQGQVYTVAGVDARLREGPQERYPSIMRLLSGELLLEIEEREGWLHVSTVTSSPRRGWVHGAQVRPMQSFPCLVISERANLRETPDDTSLRIGSLNEGAVVVKMMERSGWSQVLRDSTTVGWTRSENLEPLHDVGAIQPAVSVRRNQEAGQPIRIERQQSAIGETRMIFTLDDQTLVRDGLVKLIAFHRDRTTGQATSALFSGGDILGRERVDSSLGLVEAGIPEQVAASYYGADIFTLMARETGGGWTTELNVPDQAAITYAIMKQRGPERGTMILVDNF